MDPVVLPLDSPAALEADRVGPKAARLARLREYVRLLMDLRPIDPTKFKADPKLYGLEIGRAHV